MIPVSESIIFRRTVKKSACDDAVRVAALLSRMLQSLRHLPLYACSPLYFAWSCNLSWCKADVSDKEDEHTLLDDDEDVVEEDGVIDLVIPDRLHLRASRPAVLDSSLVKRRVVLRLSTMWFGGYIARKSQKLTSHVYDYHCLLYTSPSPRDGLLSRMPSSA